MMTSSFFAVALVMMSASAAADAGRIPNGAERLSAMDNALTWSQQSRRQLQGEQEEQTRQEQQPNQARKKEGWEGKA